MGKLNAQQIEAIECEDSLVLVEAGPGTGKTTTLIEAASSYMRQNPFEDVVLLTFTREAAASMRNKLSRSPYFVGTIHAFSQMELIKLAKEFRFRLRLLSEDQVRQILLNLLEKKSSENFIEEVFSFCFDKSVSGKGRMNAKRFSLFSEIEKQYKEYKEKNKLYDFGDTPKYLLEKIEEHNKVLSYGKVFIDEVQDLDDYQFRLIEKIKSKKFAIGDKNQSIYQFRGVSGDIFERFSKKYTVKTLEYSYRCYQDIFDYLESPLTSVKGYHPACLTTTTDSSFVLLCRTNFQVQEYEGQYSKVMTVHAAKGLEFEKVAVLNFPHFSEENRNIFYVACTRAISTLAIIDSKQKK